MNKSKKDIHIQTKEKEAHLHRVESILNQMSRPELPDLESEWNELERRIDQTGDRKPVHLFTKVRIIAASVAVIVLTAISLLCYWNLKVITYTTTVDKGSIILRDGSMISLNRNSSIQYKAGYGILNRNITLSGEAYFNVQKGKHPDFIVNTLTARIRVTGTQFNIKAGKGKTEVGVAEGRVEFASSAKPGSYVILTQGLFSNCTENSLPAHPKAIQFPDFPGWMHNRLIYNETPVSEIIRDLEEQFHIKIDIKDNAVVKLEVTGIIDGKKPEEVLQTLGILIGKRFKLNHNTYEIY